MLIKLAFDLDKNKTWWKKKTIPKDKKNKIKLFLNTVH